MQDSLGDDVRRALRVVPDFPQPGIRFQDIAPVLADARLFSRVVAHMAEPHRGQVEAVVGVESRGFILGAPVALALGAAFVPARKLGKLPGKTIRESYKLEYGEAALEIQEGALALGARALVVDDVLATGGTAAAAGRLVARAGGRVAGYEFLLEIAALGGRARVAGPMRALAAV